MAKFSKQGLIEFLSLNPLDQVLYSLHCFNAWTSVPRFYIAIKLVRLFAKLKMHKASDAIGHYSGLNKRLVRMFPELADEDMRAKYLD